MHCVASYTARWILPTSGPPIENGILVVRDDTIEAIEPKGTRKTDVDLGNVALIPGLVNTHTHLDLSGARGLIPPTDPEHFTDWLKGVIAYRRTRTAEQVQQDIHEGLAECLRAGTTLVGDIARGGMSWSDIGSQKTRGVVFRELVGLTDEWQDVYFNAYAWLDDQKNTELCRKALSPHAPYTVRRILFIMVHKLCSTQNLPQAIHIAESPAELELIEKRMGHFISFLAQFDFDEFDGLISSYVDLLEINRLCKPQQVLHGNHRIIDVFRISFRWILSIWRRGMQRGSEIDADSPVNDSVNPQIYVHCNYLNHDTPFRSNQSIVYCPRTHAAFGHPPHPFREFMKRGVRVCLGTDSLASNPDLDILAEARFVKQRYPDFDGETLLKMVTLFGAEALGWADECGSLEPGKSADAVAVPLPDRDGDPYDLLFVDAAHGERKTMFRGEWRN